MPVIREEVLYKKDHSNFKLPVLTRVHYLYHRTLLQSNIFLVQQRLEDL